MGESPHPQLETTTSAVRARSLCHEKTGIEVVEHEFKQSKRRKSQFSNYFNPVEAEQLIIGYVIAGEKALHLTSHGEYHL